MTEDITQDGRIKVRISIAKPEPISGPASREDVLSYLGSEERAGHLSGFGTALKRELEADPEADPADIWDKLENAAVAKSGYRIQRRQNPYREAPSSPIYDYSPRD